MVKTMRSASVALMVLLALVLGQQAAHASLDPGPAQGSNYGNAGTHSSGYGYGSPAHNTSGTCSLYANASNFGAACLGGGDGTLMKIEQILKGDPVPGCWDELISEATWESDYSVDHSPYPADTPEYAETCLIGLDKTKTVAEQANLKISQLTVAIPGGTPCGDPPLDAAHAALATAHQCMQTLTLNQKKVVGGFNSKLNGEIPRPAITSFPSAGHVRTQVPTAYLDTGEPAKNSQGDIQTPSVNANGTIMFARMDQASFSIDPGDGTGPVTCKDPFQTLGEGATQQNTPDSCWHTYTKDSYAQTGRVYLFTAKVQWTVYANGIPLVDQGDGHSATFTEIDTVKLEVDDVQTLVIGNSWIGTTAN